MNASTLKSPHAKLHTLALRDVQILGGFWRKKQATNSVVTLLDGYKKLQKAGNFNNLALAAGRGQGAYTGPVFMDEDVYKWLEAIAYEIGNGDDQELRRIADEVISLLGDAQQEDGYLNSYYQVAAPWQRWTDLDHGHELYCAGHLLQAAVAHFRATGQTTLLQVAIRFADHIDSIFGQGRRQGTCGHPEIEMALVELYRATGEQRYLRLAQFFVDQRGSGQMRGYRSYGPEYHQDRLPVRQAVQVEGHAVRQLYLLSGITDLYLETGEQALLDVAERLWQDAFTSKMFVTGGFGTRFEGENFGEPYELPSDSCYCETCAAIASAMWNWRMLLATGEARFADQLERVLYNGFLSGLSHDGCHYFYINPLQSRTGVTRAAWYEVACCPPNIMRQIASIGQYVATQADAGIQIHQYMDCSLRSTLPASACALRIETDYPWQGGVRITVQETADDAWSLSLRLPGWCAAPEISINDQPIPGLVPGDYALLKRRWLPGDIVVLTLPTTPRWVQPHPRIDAIRGSVAIENGPLIYCLEDVDQPAGVHLLDVRADTSQAPHVVWRGDVLDGLNMIEVPGIHSEPDSQSDALYRPLSVTEVTGAPMTLTAIPYYAWANRGSAAMRVWIPRA